MELSIDEWHKVLQSLGKAPYWFTISGGEPLLYPRAVELAKAIYEHCHPAVINIPTNAILPNIPDLVEQIATACPDSKLIINLSLDGIGEKHDRIRGVPGNFEKFEKRLASLSQLRKSVPNLTLGIHSVVSVFNVDDIDEIIRYVEDSSVDQFITEIAEPRIELDTVGLPITPSLARYSKAVDAIDAYVARRRFSGMARMTEALRTEYYKLVKRILEQQDQVIPCYAGWASAHIYADGSLWACCVRADNVGSLRDYDYDFKRLWFSQNMDGIRRRIAKKECHCPLANAAYTNMLHHVPTALRVAKNLMMGDAHTQNSAVRKSAEAA